MHTRVLFCVAVLLVGCQRAPTPLELSRDQLMVHSVLVAGNDAVQVLLEVARQEQTQYGEMIVARPVSGANVQMMVDGTTIQLEEAVEGMSPCASAHSFQPTDPPPVGLGCYSARVPGGVQPGQRYSLRVQVDGGAAVEGEASVPALPTLSRPVAGERLRVIGEPTNPLDPSSAPGILVRYTVPETTYSVETALRIDSVFVGGSRDPEAICDHDSLRQGALTERSDSLVHLVRYMHCFRPEPQGGARRVVPDSAYAHLMIAAFDSTYMRYVQAAGGGSAEHSRLRAGISGALGVFAGVSAAEQRIVLLPRRADPQAAATPN